MPMCCGLQRARAVRLGGALLSCRQDIVARMPDLDCVIVSGKNAYGKNCCPTNSGAKLLIRNRRDP